MSKIPKFKSLEEERTFWDTHDATEYLEDLKPAKITFARPKKKLISLRLDTSHLEQLRAIAAAKGIAYLTLTRMWLIDRINREHRPAHSHHS